MTRSLSVGSRPAGPRHPVLLLAALLVAVAACKPPSSVPPLADSERPGMDTRGGKAGGGDPRRAAPDFQKAIAVTFAWDAERSAVVAKIHLEPGFHAYGPGERTGKPLAMEITGEDWKQQEVKIPQGVEKDLGDMGKSYVVTGDVEAVAVVKAAGETKEPVTGLLRYQVCTDTSCDRPRSMPFSVPPT